MPSVPGLSTKPGVLVAASGQAWEVDALPALADAGAVVLKRCVDLTDLLASARSGQADVALVDSEMPGLDGDAITQLLRSDVRTVAVSASEADADGRGIDPDRLSRIGVVATVAATGEAIVEAVTAAAVQELVPDPSPIAADAPLPVRAVAGKVIAVWGPAGAPGRTTVAAALAAQRARTHPAILVDADPYGGVVAQHLGILDEVSGLLAAARLVNTGGLDRASLAAARRRIGDRLDVLTGLPRADRWVEVRSGVLPEVVEQAVEVADVVLDTGFSVEHDPDSGRSIGRNQLTLDAIEVADEVIVVGSADPTGLARLARGLVELQEVAPGVACRVVVNRMRDSLGWGRNDILGMIEGYVRPLGTHFLPDDRAGVDRALVAGRTLVEVGETAIGRAMGEVTDAVFPARAGLVDVPVSSSSTAQPVQPGDPGSGPRVAPDAWPAGPAVAAPPPRPAPPPPWGQGPLTPPPPRPPDTQGPQSRPGAGLPPFGQRPGDGSSGNPTSGR